MQYDNLRKEFRDNTTESKICQCKSGKKIERNILRLLKAPAATNASAKRYSLGYEIPYIKYIKNYSIKKKMKIFSSNIFLLLNTIFLVRLFQLGYLPNCIGGILFVPTVEPPLTEIC